MDEKIFVIFTALVTLNFGALIFCTVAELGNSHTSEKKNPEIHKNTQKYRNILNKS